MLEVKIPKEITDYHERIIAGLSLRQLICMGIGIPLCAGSYWIARTYIGDDAASYLIMILIIPFFCFGFIKKDGMFFEKYAVLWLRHQLGNNVKKYEVKFENGGNDNGFSKTKDTKSKEYDRGFYGELTKKERKERKKTVKNKLQQATKEYREANQRAKN